MARKMFEKLGLWDMMYSQMKRFFALIAIVCLSNITTAQESNTELEAERTYEGDYYSFSIRLPRKWYVSEDIEYKDGEKLIFEAISENSSFSVVIIDLYNQIDVVNTSKISRFDFDKYFNEDVNQVLDNSIQVVKNNFDAAKIIESEFTKFLNIPATRIFFSWKPLPNNKVFTEYWQFIHCAIFYIITKATTEKSTENEIELIDKSLATFRLNLLELSEKVFVPITETYVKPQSIIDRVSGGLGVWLILFGIIGAIFITTKYIIKAVQKKYK